MDFSLCAGWFSIPTADFLWDCGEPGSRGRPASENPSACQTMREHKGVNDKQMKGGFPTPARALWFLACLPRFLLPTCLLSSSPPSRSRYLTPLSFLSLWLLLTCSTEGQSHVIFCATSLLDTQNRPHSRHPVCFSGLSVTEVESRQVQKGHNANLHLRRPPPPKVFLLTPTPTPYTLVSSWTDKLEILNI